MNSSTSNRRCRLGHNTSSKERGQEIDLALAVMCALQKPGEIVPYRVIAEVTGLSHGGPFMIEKNALKKIRNRVRFGRDARVHKELVA